MKYRPRRRPTEFDAVLIAESGDYPVKLKNVAPEGVKVVGFQGYIHPDADVKLVVQGRHLPGRVSWVDQDTAGVKLKTPMPKEMVAQIARTMGGGGYLRHRP